jgi:hypothetical protein
MLPPPVASAPADDTLTRETIVVVEALAVFTAEYSRTGCRTGLIDARTAADAGFEARRPQGGHGPKKNTLNKPVRALSEQAHFSVLQ